MTYPALTLQDITAMEDLLRWEALLGPRGLDLVTRVPRPGFPGMSLAGLPAGQDGRRAALPPTLEEPLAGRLEEVRRVEDHREDLLVVDRAPGRTPTHREVTTMVRPQTRTVPPPSTHGRTATLSSTG